MTGESIYTGVIIACDTGTGYNDRQYVFVLYNRADLPHKTPETAHFCLLVRFKQQAKRSDRRECF